MFPLYVSLHTYVLIKCLWVKQFLTKRSISTFFGQKSFCWNSVWSKKQWPQNLVTKYMYFKSFGIRLTRFCKFSSFGLLFKGPKQIYLGKIRFVVGNSGRCFSIFWFGYSFGYFFQDMGKFLPNLLVTLFVIPQCWPNVFRSNSFWPKDLIPHLLVKRVEQRLV